MNSPWGRSYERISDCQRWISQGHAALIDGALLFTDSFFLNCQQQAREANPDGFDDGVLKRWVNRQAKQSSLSDVAPAVAIAGNLIGSQGKEITTSWGRHPVKQLLPVKIVGTGSFVTKNPDRLMRRHRRFRTIEPGRPEHN